MDAQLFSRAYAGLVEDYPPLDALSDPGRFQESLELLSKQCPPGATVADIGAWPGGLSGCLKRLGWKVFAVDKNTARSMSWSQNGLLDQAGNKVGQRDSLESFCEAEGIAVASCDIESEPLPFDSGTLDAVVFTEVIEHLWHDPLLALSEINRVLKPKGTLILSTPNFTCLRHRLNFLRGRIDQVIEHPFVSFLKSKRLGHAGHVRLYAPQELTGMLRVFGFSTHTDLLRYSDLRYLGPRVVSNNNGSGKTPTTPPQKAGRNALARLGGKFFRSPRRYWSALCATSLQLAEKLVPRFRPQLFITATKERDADFDKNYPEQVKALVLQNRITI
jgi:SAM-dependent methyltransferase